MNKHILIDNITAVAGSWLSGGNKFFSASIDSPSFGFFFQDIRLELPDISEEKTIEISAKTPVGDLDTAVKTEKWIGFDYPTIIYHHGNNERSMDYSNKTKNVFWNIFVKARNEFDANILVVRAPFHNSTLKVYQEKITRLDNFMAMISVSVMMNQAIISQLREKGCSNIITTGVSLGGWVCNLHRSYFNTSDIYIPVMAGSFLGELFLQSKYRKLTSVRALQNADIIREKLNFDTSFSKNTDQNIFPLLAVHDQFILYSLEKNSYEEYPLEKIDAGHVTGALQTHIIRGHILKLLKHKLSLTEQK
jgi:hypothetical protein